MADNEMVSSPETTKEGGEQVQPKGDASTPAEKGEKLPWHEDKRFKEFLAEKKKFDIYKELGDPDTLKDAVSKAKILDQLAKDADQAPASKEKDEQKALIEAARKDLFTLLPELQYLLQQTQRGEMFFTDAEAEARDATEALLLEHGLSAEKGDITQMEETLSNIILQDKGLKRRFYRDPDGTVKKAFEKAMTKFKSAADLKAAAKVQADKEPSTKLPKTHTGSGGVTASEVKGPPKSLKEAYDLHRKSLG